jgi:hypothetical protein
MKKGMDSSQLLDYRCPSGCGRQRRPLCRTDAQLHDLNLKLLESERKLTDPAGLPRRPWYKHVLDAPGVYTGYEAKTIPGVREAIEQKRWQEADQQIEQVAKVLEGEVELIDSATKELASWAAAP